MVDWCVLVSGDLLLGDAQFMHNGTVAKKRVRVMGASLVVLLTTLASGSAVSADLSSPRVLVPTLEAFCKPATVQGRILRVRESAG
jgi:hypothetical protein